MSQRLGKRLKVDQSSWDRMARYDYGPVPEGVRYCVADLKEGDHRWHSGAHKVTLPPGSPYRSTTFYGETAWSDAARLIHDYETWRRYNR